MPTPIQTITYRAADGVVYGSLHDAIKADHRKIVSDRLHEFAMLRRAWPASTADVLEDLKTFLAEYGLTIVPINFNEDC